MINGIGYPKFYIYDSTGVTLQTIPTNLGTSGVISLTKRVIVNEKQPDRYDIVNESPYTRTELREFLGYKYKCSLTVVQEDYLQGLLQYTADQATTKVTDIYKLKAIEAYANAGYKIKFTPHNDLEDLWGSQFPIWVDVKITRTGKSQRIYSDSFSMEIHGTELLNSPYPFTAFSFTTSSGVANTNQCIDLNGTTNYCSVGTPYSIGTTHSIELWTDSDMPADGTLDVMLGTAHTGSLFSYLTFTGTGDYITYNVQDGASNYGVQVAAGTVAAGTKHHWVVVRSGTSVAFYKDGAQIGATQTLGSNQAFTVSYVGALSASTHFFDGKMGHLRIYQTAITDAQVKLQYNSGYGNWPLDIPLYAVYEFDGSGGTGLAEDNQETTATKDLTLSHSIRTTW